MSTNLNILAAGGRLRSTRSKRFFARRHARRYSLTRLGLRDRVCVTTDRPGQGSGPLPVSTVDRPRSFPRCRVNPLAVHTDEQRVDLAARGPARPRLPGKRHPCETPARKVAMFACGPLELIPGRPLSGHDDSVRQPHVRGRSKANMRCRRSPHGQQASEAGRRQLVLVAIARP